MEFEVKSLDKYEIMVYNNDIDDDRKEFRRWEILKSIDDAYISSIILIC